MPDTTMSPAPYRRRSRRRPPVDQVVLAGLRQDVGDVALRSFIRTYIDLLVLRLARIEQAIGRRDIADAVNTAVDLRTTSAMLGAGQLAEMAAGVERLLGQGQTDTAVARMPDLRSEAAAVVASLLLETNGRSIGH
jgi:HPt (histidine-containing phosphotransfer) domain-containing protein